MTMRRLLCTLAIPAACLVTGQLHVQADGPAGTAEGIAQDHRLGTLRTLDDDFPFTAPENAAEWETRTSEVRRRIQVALGLWPMPERTPLNAVVHGRVAREGYTVEKVYFESLPGHFVTGSLYRPSGSSGRLPALSLSPLDPARGDPEALEGSKRPAVLLPHGHWDGGRFNEASEADVRHAIVTGAERFAQSGRYPLQAGAVQLARMGVVAFLFDLEGYADSVQIPIDVAHSASHGRPARSPAAPGLFFSADAELRLESIMGLQTWNASRALDFLLSLPDVDPKRVAVSGASGGGTQTFILGALDARPATLFPMVMVGTRMQGGCTCENADYLRIGTGNVEIAGLAAPRPLGMTTADDWTKTMPETGFPGLQRLYALLGAPTEVAIFPFPQFPHNYNYVSRSAMYAWMNSHLGLGLPEPVVQEDFVPLTRGEASVWDAEHPMPASGDAEERRVTSWWAKVSEDQMARLTPRDQDSMARYREIVGGAVAVMIGRDLPGPSDVVGDVIGSSHAAGVTVRRGLLRQPRWHEVTPFVELVPAAPNGEAIVWLDARGTAALLDGTGHPVPAVAEALKRGARVIGIDVFLTGAFLAEGQTAANRLVDGPKFAPYTFGYNPPLIVERVHDVMAALRFARSGDTPVLEPLSITPQSPTEARDLPPAGERQSAPTRVYLVGLGPDAGVWALLARAMAPALLDGAAIDTAGFRFGAVTAIDDPAMLPGGVKYGDVPALLALGAPGRLWLAGEGKAAPAVVAAAYQATGARQALTMATPSSASAARAAVRWMLQ